MKLILASVFILYILQFLPQSLQNGLTSVQFGYTGDVQYFTVPPGVNLIYLDIKGGSGGTDYYGSPEYLGGFGGHVQTQLEVVPNSTYYIFIGLIFVFLYLPTTL